MRKVVPVMKSVSGLARKQTAAAISIGCPSLLTVWCTMFLRTYCLPNSGSSLVFVFWAPGNALDLEVPARRGLFLAADRRRIESEELAVAVIDAHVPRRLVDYDRHFRQIVARLRRIWRRDAFDGRPAGPPRHLRHRCEGEFRSRARAI